MKACAKDSIYWPGMNASICNVGANCRVCFNIVLSQPQELITLTQSPDWPFQQIVMDLFHVGDQQYLACADRLTRRLILYHLSHGQVNASRIISIC